MFEDVTFVIPIKYDSEERKQNLDIVRKDLMYYECNIVVLEDIETIFHRTKLINRLIKQVETPIVGVWDADVILSRDQVIGAKNAITDGATLSYPHSGF